MKRNLANEMSNIAIALITTNLFLIFVHITENGSNDLAGEQSSGIMFSCG